MKFLHATISLANSSVKMMLGFNSLAPIAYEAAVKDPNATNTPVVNAPGRLEKFAFDYNEKETVQVNTIYNNNDIVQVKIPSKIQVDNANADTTVQLKFILDKQIVICNYAFTKADELGFTSCPDQDLEALDTVALQKITVGLAFKKALARKGKLSFETLLTAQRPGPGGPL